MDAEVGNFNLVLFWKINRMSRSTKDLLHIVDTLSKSKVGFRSFSEDFETESGMGRFALTMMGAVGELERDTIVDNVKMGMKQRAREGRWNGGIVLGYKSVKINDDLKSKETRLEVVPEEAMIVESIYDFYRSGKGLKSIANEINHQGHKTKRGKAFSTSAIKEIITNPVYAGKIRFNRFENWSERRRKGKTNEPILVDGQHEAIIPLKIWEEVQVLQQMKSFKPKRMFDGKFLLTGLMKCPECGASMSGYKTTNKLKDGTKKILRYYSCSAFRSKGSSVCSSNGIRADYAEKVVFNELKRLISDDRFLRSVVDNLNKKRVHNIEPLEQELDMTRMSIISLRQKQTKYFEMLEQNVLGTDVIKDRINDLGEQIEAQIARADELEQMLMNTSSGELEYEYVKDKLSQVDEFLSDADHEKIKTLLHLMIDSIEVTKDKSIKTIVIKWNEHIQSFIEASSPENGEGAFSIGQNVAVKPFVLKLKVA